MSNCIFEMSLQRPHGECEHCFEPFTHEQRAWVHIKNGKEWHPAHFACIKTWQQYKGDQCSCQSCRVLIADVIPIEINPNPAKAELAWIDELSAAQEALSPEAKAKQTNSLRQVIRLCISGRFSKWLARSEQPSSDDVSLLRRANKELELLDKNDGLVPAFASLRNKVGKILSREKQTVQEPLNSPEKKDWIRDVIAVQESLEPRQKHSQSWRSRKVIALCATGKLSKWLEGVERPSQEDVQLLRDARKEFSAIDGDCKNPQNFSELRKNITKIIVKEQNRRSEEQMPIQTKILLAIDRCAAWVLGCFLS